MDSMLLGVLSGLCLVVGSIFAIIGGIGLLRLPDFFCRMHASGITDTLGAYLILLGLMIQAGLTLVTVKLLMILFFLMISGPTSAHALAKSALTAGLEPLVAEPEEDR